MSTKLAKAARAAPSSALDARWRQLTRISPYSRELGLELAHAGADWCVLRVPYAEKLIGYPETRVLHGGVITALMDVAFGLAIFVRLGELRPMATLDLRIDYLKPATPD
ncbi:MAG: PaaI family thioesterase, partial [Pseudomonadota bacterium]